MAEINAFQADSLQAAPEQNTNTELRDRLISSREQKIARLAPKTGYGELDRQPNTFVDMGDYRESMANKIVNDYSPAELDAIAEDLNRRFGVVVEGNQAFQYDDQGNKIPYEGNVNTLASFYEYGTKDGGFKIGTWGGVDPYERYSDSYLAHQNEVIGDRGVNRDDLRRHYILPIEQVDLLEGLYHGNTNFLNNRSLRQSLDQVQGQGLIEYQEARKAFGSGATEVYNTFDRGNVEDTDTKALFREFNERFFPEPLTDEQIKRNLRDQLKRRDAEEGVGLINRLGNAVAGIAPAVASQLFIEPAMAIAEMMGYTPDTTSEERILAVQEAMGYNNAFADKAVSEVSEKVSKIIEDVQNDRDVDVADVWDMFVSAGSSPELLTTSVAAVVAMSVGFGKFTRMGKAIAEVDKLKKAGRISPEEAKNRIYDIKEAHSLMDNIAHLGARNAGFIASVAGDVNGRVERFMANNEGEHTPNDIIRLTAASTAAMALDRFSGQLAMGNIKGVIDRASMDAIRDIVDTLPPNQYADFLKLSGAALGRIVESAVVEGSTEYVQTLIDITSTQYATKKYGDDLSEIVLNKENQIEFITGAVLGSVMGAQMSAGGIAVRTGADLLQNVTLPTRLPSDTPPVVEDSGSTITEEEMSEDRITYNDTLNRLVELLDTGNLQEATLGDHLADIEALRRTRSSVADVDPTVKEAADAALREVEDKIASLILNSADGRISLNRIITDTGTVLNSTPTDSGLSDVARRALAETAVDIISARKSGNLSAEETVKLNNFGTVNGLDTARVEEIVKSYASVETEATIETRGILGRERELDLMLGSGTVSSRRVQRSYDESVNWLSTTLSSIAQLKDGIAKAEEIARTANNADYKPKSIKPVITEYKKYGSTSAKPLLFDITISNQNGTFVAQTAAAKELIVAKERTVAGLSKLLNKFHQEAAEHLDEDKLLTSGGYKVPTKTTSDKTGTAAERSYIDNVKKVLKTDSRIGSTINKIIVGEKPSSRWSATGERFRTNASLVNSGTYVESDIVYLHSKEKYNVAKKGETPHYKSELYKTESNTAAKEIKAAMEAGATIVLDNEFQSGKPEGILLVEFMHNNGYIAYGARSGENAVEASIFVPDNEVNARRLAESKDRAAKVKEAKELETKQKGKLQRLALKEAALKVREGDTSTISDELIEAIDAVRVYFKDRAAKQVQSTLPEGEVATTEQINAKVEENIRSYMSNSNIRAVRELRLYLERENKELSDIDSMDQYLRTLVEADIARTAELEKEAEVALTSWKAAKELRLTGKELIAALNTSLASIGKHVSNRKKDENTIVLKDIGNTILTRSVGATTNLKTYAIEATVNKGANPKTEVLYPRYNSDLYKVGSTFTENGIKRTVKNVNEVLNNPTSYVQVSKATPLNTLSIESMPAVFTRISNQMTKVLTTVIPKLEAVEIDVKAVRKTKEENNIVSKLFDSPARSLLLDVDGKIHPNAAVAVGVAIGDLLKTDTMKLTLGNKDTNTVANVFGVTESEVTSAMRKVVSENGGLAKTVVNTLGKSVLTALGMTRIKNNNINRGQYERLVSDLGNYVLKAAEEQGLLKTSTVPSNELAKLFADGETFSTNEITHFVHIPSTRKKDDSGVFKTTFSKTINSFNDDFNTIETFMPDAVNTVKAPYFGKNTIPKDEYLSTIRNDIVGGQVPQQAKKALTSFMDTAHELDMNNLGKFLEELKDEENKAGIYKSLGYIEASMDNPAYVALTYDQKEVQEAINLGVEKSIEQLSKYYESVTKGLENTMYFPFYYTGNHRYMMDSNTLNGQADKLHRFFVRPKAHVITYDVNRADNTFSHTYTKNGKQETIDTSLYVRVALVQGAGVKDGIDKTSTNEIIRLGNILLSMTAEDAVTARKELIRNGKFSVISEGETISFEPDHLSHGLQALEFIRKYKSNEDSTLTDGLTAEFDALTSGFSNKVQQFGILSDLTEHMRRVGIVEAGNPASNVFSTLGKGINDMLSNKELLDSYQNLGRDTITDLNNQSELLEGKAKQLFEDLTPLLPGADQRSLDKQLIQVSSALRKLFKPAFMIFNYSASINRIVTNLGEAMSASIFSEIASADLATIEPVKRASMEALAKLVYTTGKTNGISLKELQRRIREESIDKLKVEVSEWSVASNENKLSYVTLEKYLIDTVIKPTYGRSVQSSFEKNFKEFIQIQKVTNDAFKMSYAVFAKALQNRVSQYREETNNSPISEATLLGFISELRDAFPVIAGPLSKELEEGVHVYSADTRTVSGTLATSVSPKIHYTDGDSTTSRKMNPLIKSILAAVNSGAVLPFHALDGAQLALMVNKFVAEYMENATTKDGATLGSGILPIHDAYMGPLHMADILGFMYNQETISLNKTYSVLGEIAAMVERAQSILDGKHPTIKVDVSTIEQVKSISVVDKKELRENKKAIAAMETKLEKLKESNADATKIANVKTALAELKNKFSFENTFKAVSGNITLQNRLVEQQRANLFKEGTRLGVMVATPGSVVRYGDTAPDLSYLTSTELTSQYVTVPVQVVSGSEAPKAKVPAKNLGEKFAGMDESLAAQGAISNTVLYVTTRGMPKNNAILNAAKGVRLGTNVNPTEDSVIMVTTADKVASGEYLTDVEVEAVHEAWSQTYKLASSALKKGATLVFSSDAESTTDLGDNAVVGDSYIFQRLTQGKNYHVEEVMVDGVPVFKVTKEAPVVEQSELTDAELDDTSNAGNALAIMAKSKNRVKTNLAAVSKTLAALSEQCVKNT